MIFFFDYFLCNLTLIETSYFCNSIDFNQTVNISELRDIDTDIIITDNNTEYMMEATRIRSRVSEHIYRSYSWSCKYHSMDSAALGSEHVV